jgi:hypothetical protein
MNSLNQIAYRILNTITPKMVDDQSIDISEIKYDVENIRATILKRTYSKGFKSAIPESITQSIPKLEIENANASTVLPDLTSNMVLMKTVLPIPSILEKSSGMPLVKRISAATILSHNFTFVTPEQAICSGNGKFNQKNIFVFYEGDYLYLITKRLLNKGLKYIDINAVFNKPTEVNEFLNDNNGGNFTDDSPYPISMNMIDDIENSILKKLRLEASQPIDDINDSSDTPKQINNPAI